MIGPNGDGKSAVATPDGRFQTKCKKILNSITNHNIIF